ncbi:hypothetical protein [Morganella morganii]
MNSNVIELYGAKRFQEKLPSGSSQSGPFANHKNDGYTDYENNISEDGSNMTREELDAKLAQNKAEVQAIASGMREEMAVWREAQNAQMTQMNATLTSMSAKIDAKFEVLNAKIDSVDKSLGGRIDGLNIAVSGIQSGISIRLAVFSAFIAVLLAVASWWISSNQSSPQPPQHQPTVTHVQQPTPSGPPQPTNNSK